MHKDTSFNGEDGIRQAKITKEIKDRNHLWERWNPVRTIENIVISNKDLNSLRKKINAKLEQAYNKIVDVIPFKLKNGKRIYK